MGLFDKIMGGLFGSSGGGAQMDWGQLERIMDLQARLNRFNDIGLFGGTKWSEGPDGSWTRTQEVHPGLQEGIANLMASATQRRDPSAYNYQMPDQFHSLMDAKMANQMQRHGILDPNEQNPSWSLRQSEYGTRIGDQRPPQQQFPMPTDQQRIPYAQMQQQAPMPPGYRPPYGGPVFGGGKGEVPNRPHSIFG